VSRHRWPDRCGSCVRVSIRPMAAAWRGSLAIIPSSTTGDDAELTSAAARSSASDGPAPSDTGSTGVSTRSGAVPRIRSIGSPTKLAPGRPPSAARKALATTSAMAAAESTSTLYLVIGSKNLTESRFWCVRSRRLASGTDPPKPTTGVPSAVAVAKPVARFVDPGPDVTRHTLALPVSRPIPCAMNAAFCSWRQTTVWIDESTSAL
jgi:hypothetical protein